MISRIGKYKLFRRLIEFSVLLILFSPVLGFSFFEGSLITSNLFGIPLTDPVAFLEYSLAAKSFYIVLFTGFVIIVLFYFLLRGRTFCSYFCPIHLISEANSKLHKRFKIRSMTFQLGSKYWSLGISLFLSLILSIPLFTTISPIGIVSRFISESFILRNKGIEDGIFFTLNISITVVFLISIIEIFFAENVWCRNLCPVGGFYSLLGSKSVMKVKIDHDKCVQCDECFSVCMVNEVLTDPVYNDSNFVKNGNCSNCFNCIDACPEQALKISLNFNKENKNV